MSIRDNVRGGKAGERMCRLREALVVIALIAPSTAMAASQSFYAKTLRISWNESRSQRSAGDPVFKPVSLPFTYSIYVSSKGQVFRRLNSVSSSGRARGTKDRVGVSGSGADSAGQITFQGNTLIAKLVSGGLGRRITVSFDGGSSCSAEVISGKAGSGVTSVRSVATGNMVEFESVSAGAASCSVQEGNAFAN